MVENHAGRFAHSNAPIAHVRTQEADVPGVFAAIPTKVAAHFGLELSADETRRMTAVAAHYSKEPGEPVPFEADSADKQRRAPAAVRALVEEHLQPLYRQLGSRRLTAPIEIRRA